MNIPHRIQWTKIGILPLIPLALLLSCSGEKASKESFRFEQQLFHQSAAALHDSIYGHHPALVPFYRAFFEEVLQIGPDTLPGFAGQLESFKSDTLISGVYRAIQEKDQTFEWQLGRVSHALDRWSGITGTHAPLVVTYLSGFNQSFVALPGILGIGLDRYLGPESPYYKGLDIPVYIRATMKPENLAADAVRAWLYSELPEPRSGSFLDRMVYEGKIHYLTGQLLGNEKEEQLFHLTREQVRWCKEHEEAMWKYLAEQKILFSTDRMTARRFLEEAPFTRDFGNDSPGRAGIWIGYRIVSSYMKSNRLDLKTLAGRTDAREILAGSNYHP